jgi:hypothetical protein
MAKKSKTPEKALDKSSLKQGMPVIDFFERPIAIFGFFVLLLILMTLLYQPLVFEDMEPGGSDAVSGIARTKQLKDWQKKTGDYPLWNPYMFGGMPTYHRQSPQAWSVDTLLEKMDILGDWRIWYFLAGALGIFLLVKYLGLSSLAAMISAAAFILMPHFQALVLVGHYAKFRALMWMPYVLLTFLFLTKKKNLLGMLLFSLALALQLRTQHYQIIFYTLLLILFMGIPILFQYLKNKDWNPIGKLALYGSIALILAVLVVAQNFLSIKEYTPYSTRGGYAISIDNQTKDAEESKGVGFDYATNWSYSVSELWNLIIPKFHGGTSNEIYTGDAVPGWRNRELPTYWGTMPFTQSYEYMGILVVFLALIGIIFQWHHWQVKSLTLLTMLALLLSFGKNFDLLYKLFFYYVPYFDKFRAPVMILTLVMFTLTILAAYGIQFLLKSDLNRKEILNRFYTLFIVSVVLFLIPLALGSTFALSQPNEIQRYNQEVVNMLKKVRLEMLRDSTIISLIFLLSGIIGVWGIIRSWFRREYVILVFWGIIIFDFMLINFPYLKDKFVDPSRIQQQYAANEIDNVILRDKEPYRVFPVGQLFSDVHWVYRHQSIGGYSPAKMQLIQEIVENNLYKNIGGRYPINWHVLDMLNAKYLITNQELVDSRLVKISSIPQRNLFAYRNKEALPRAFFVKDHTVIPDGVERLKYLNRPDFKPDSLAILEEEPATDYQFPDSSRINLTTFTPETVTWQVYSSTNALLVVSEVFYPPAWKAVLDDNEELKIFKTNHLLRSVIIPPGTHSLSFRFEPKTFYTGVNISATSLIILYLLVIALIYKEYGNSLLQSFRRTRKE